MAESLSKASPDRLEHHREFRHHGDLVVFGFQRLRRKYHPTTAERPGSPYVEHALSALSIDKVTTQKALANQLQSSILPPLEEHITSLLLALDVSRLRNEPGPNLSLVLQIQADLNYRLDQIKYLIATLYPEPTSVPNRTDDHDLEEFKAYRLSHQKINSEGMLALCMCGILNAANELIKQMNLSSTPSVAGGDTCSLEKTFHVSVCYAFATIEVMSDCFQVSELALVQNSWRGGRTSIRATLQSTIEKLTPSFNPTNVENQSQPPPKFIGETPWRTLNCLSALGLAHLKSIGLYSSPRREGEAARTPRAREARGIVQLEAAPAAPVPRCGRMHLEACGLPDKPRDCWHYGDLAVFGFERLREKYNPTDAELPDPPHIEHAFSALCIDKLSYRMYDIFGAAVELIQHAGLSSTPLTAEGDTNSLQKTLRFSVNHALHNIKMMTNCLQASELTVVQDSWQRRRGCIRTMLQSTVEKLTLSTNSTSAKYQAQPPEKFVGETVIQLAKLTLPIMKLCKIFFAKFSNRGLALERLPNFTEISSGQLEDLVNSVGHVVDDIRQLMLHLSFANGHPGGDATSEDFTRIAKSLKSRFESPLFLVLMYFIPLIPDPDGLNVQKYYTSWCVTWNNQMAVAIKNFIHVAESYIDIP
ncbi:hypothetical protein PtB15_18B390 [Puccinia triticina]|nr:hypothetical protein PtB15_18B390 [Puccinia triticina]